MPVALQGQRVWGLDFSHKMLEEAADKLPTVRLVGADLLGELPRDWPLFDRIVSAYVFHEFDLPTKVRLLVRLTRLLGPGGLVVLGDLAFPNSEERDLAHQPRKEVWDQDEHYWAADEALSALAKAGLRGEYRQISIAPE